MRKSRNPRLTEDNKSQIDKFKEAAREAECDMDEEGFDKALGKLAKSQKSDLKNQQPDDNVKEIEKP